MALTTLAVQRANQTPGKMLNAMPSTIGADTGKVYAATSDFEFVNDGQTLLMVNNQQAAATTAVTIVPPNVSKDGVAFAPTAAAGDTIPAVRTAFFGPFPTGLNNADGKIVGTINPITTCFIAAISLGK